MTYVLAIDQSTAGTKAILFDNEGAPAYRHSLPHRQIVDKRGWVSHDPMEIYANTVGAVRGVVEKSGVPKSSIACVGISNQRETALVWARMSGVPVMDAVVWQCNRGQAICDRLAGSGSAILAKTGLPLSPYFSAAKIAWVLGEAGQLQHRDLCAGTVDSWLIYKLTGGKCFYTDYSNASRTQLMDIGALRWDEDICSLFNIKPSMLPEIRDSDGCFGETDFEGFFDSPIPIHAALGDSHAALFGQGCDRVGMAKATYGTGSSVMMNVGPKKVPSSKGLAASLAWRMGGLATYVLEGNINYSCAVIKWLVDSLGLLASDREAGAVAGAANPMDSTYIVPAFTGLGAPHWKPDAKALIRGMTRTTGKAEIVRAAEESIAYQIADVVDAMSGESGLTMQELRADGGAANDGFLMQFQSDILNIPVAAASMADLSAFGAAAAAGIALGIYPASVTQSVTRVRYVPAMEQAARQQKRAGWFDALASL
ncbi:MAG: glycerol kinase GlpK [Oscillospiraceae bacterium]|nr:glycerol kinase GlpK [Oscillospiraceae bacterium]